MGGARRVATQSGCVALDTLPPASRSSMQEAGMENLRDLFEPVDDAWSRSAGQIIVKRIDPVIDYGAYRAPARSRQPLLAAVGAVGGVAESRNHLRIVAQQRLWADSCG